MGDLRCLHPGTGLKPAIKSKSTVANKYISTSPKNNKKKSRQVVRVSQGPHIKWADQSTVDGKLTHVELYWDAQWLVQSKPSIANTPFVEITSRTQGSAETKEEEEKEKVLEKNEEKETKEEDQEVQEAEDEEKKEKVERKEEEKEEVDEEEKKEESVEQKKEEGGTEEKVRDTETPHLPSTREGDERTEEVEAESGTREKAKQNNQWEMSTKEEKQKPLSAKAAKRAKQREKADAIKRLQEKKRSNASAPPNFSEQEAPHEPEETPTSTTPGSPPDTPSSTLANTAPCVSTAAAKEIEAEVEKKGAKKTEVQKEKKKDKAMVWEEVSVKEVVAKCRGCGSEVDGKLECPLCAKAGQHSFFCSQTCFKASWTEHKKLVHETSLTPKSSSSSSSSSLSSFNTTCAASNAGKSRTSKPPISPSKKSSNDQAAEVELQKAQKKGGEGGGGATVVVLLQQGKDQTVAGSVATKSGQYSEAALHYETAIRLFQRSAQAGNKLARGDETSYYIRGGLLAEADCWKKLGNVRDLSLQSKGGECPTSLAQVMKALLRSLCLFNALGQPREAVHVMVDLARLRLAHAQTSDLLGVEVLLIQASHMLSSVDPKVSLLLHASLLKFIADLKTELHLASPSGWSSAQAGQQEDLSLVASAAVQLRQAEKLFASKESSLNQEVMGDVRFSLCKSTLLAGNFQEAKNCLALVLANSEWCKCNESGAHRAKEMSEKLKNF